jgi:hypothetical protein
MICVESVLQFNPTRYLSLGQGLRGSGKPSKRSLPVPSRPRHMFRLVMVTPFNTTTYHKHTVFKTWLYSFHLTVRGNGGSRRQPNQLTATAAGGLSFVFSRSRSHNNHTFMKASAL